MLGKINQRQNTKSQNYLKLFEPIVHYDFSENLTQEVFKAQGILDYERFMNYNKTKEMPVNFVVFDFETTGLDAQCEEIIQVSAIKFRKKRPIALFDSYVKPTKEIPAHITEINGITNEKVKDAFDLKTVMQHFLNFISDDCLIAHRASFDMSFFLNSLYHLGFEPPQNKVIDTLNLSRKYVRLFDGEKGVGLTNYKLETLKHLFSLSELASHEGIADCKVCAYIYLKIYEAGGEKIYINHLDKNE